MDWQKFFIFAVFAFSIGLSLSLVLMVFPGFGLFLSVVFSIVTLIGAFRPLPMIGLTNRLYSILLFALIGVPFTIWSIGLVW